MDGLGLIIIVGLIMVVGLAGVVLPVLPGVPIMWAAALLYGIFAGFGTAGVTAMVAITVLTAIGIAAGIVLPQRAGRASGASSDALRFGLLLGVIGFFVLPGLGFPIGFVVGVLVIEFRNSNDFDTAWRSTVGVIKGIGAGVVAELGAGVGIALVWIAWVFAQGGIDAVT
jgi:hypothetical protein